MFGHARRHIVAAATLGALREAARAGRGALSPGMRATGAGMLRGHAAALLTSPIARDQLLTLSLTAAAEDLDAGRCPGGKVRYALPRHRADEAMRPEIRRDAAAAGPVRAAEIRRVVDGLELRHRPECADDVGLADRLAEEARLHQALWDDPGLRCAPHVRLVMLFSARPLFERSEALRRRRGSAPARAGLTAPAVPGDVAAPLATG
jgi:hypothetical protein